MLVQMRFGKDDIKKWLCQLSGGELTKLMLLKILSGEYNILFMDEHSNFLDTYAIDIIYKLGWIKSSKDKYILRVLLIPI